MSHHDDRVIFFQFGDQFLDLHGRDRVQRRTGFVHQQHFRLHRQQPGDAQALLLPAGQRHRRRLQPVLDLVPERRADEAPFHQFVENRLVFLAMDAWPVGDIVVDRHGKRIGALEHHAHPLAQMHHVHVGREDVFTIEQNLALDADAFDQVVHPVQSLQKRGLAAAGRADQGQHAVLRHVDRYFVQRQVLAVKEFQLAHLNFVFHRDFLPVDGLPRYSASY